MVIVGLVVRTLLVAVVPSAVVVPQLSTAVAGAFVAHETVIELAVTAAEITEIVDGIAPPGDGAGDGAGAGAGLGAAGGGELGPGTGARGSYLKAHT